MELNDVELSDFRNRALQAVQYGYEIALADQYMAALAAEVGQEIIPEGVTKSSPAHLLALAEEAMSLRAGGGRKKSKKESKKAEPEAHKEPKAVEKPKEEPKEEPKIEEPKVEAKKGDTLPSPGQDEGAVPVDQRVTVPSEAPAPSPAQGGELPSKKHEHSSGKKKN